MQVIAPDVNVVRRRLTPTATVDLDATSRNMIDFIVNYPPIRARAGYSVAVRIPGGRVRVVPANRGVLLLDNVTKENNIVRAARHPTER